jgi:hypothetical protein
MSRFLYLTLAAFLLMADARAQSMSDISKNFIATLDASQKPLTIFPFESDERYNFHFFLSMTGKDYHG